MATVRPVFQHQGPASNCTIDGLELGWLSCTAYAMAMLIDAATNGEQRPKGCTIRRKVTPKDTDGGLCLRQVADVAAKEYGVVVSVRTGKHAVTTKKATEQVVKGRGFLLQGNNEAFKDKGNGDHAIWVNEVRGGSPTEPEEALVYDPQREHEVWIKWTKVLAFGAALHLNPTGTRKLGPGFLYAGFPPARPTPAEMAALPSAIIESGVHLRFDAKLTKRQPDRVRGLAPAGRKVNVRRRPDSLAKKDIVDTLDDHELFLAYQRTTKGLKPGGSNSRVWFGNKDGTLWVHESGLAHIGGIS
jgi:hypothetical protein